jgi:hypothetical protein
MKFRNMTPAQLRLIVTAAVAVNRVDHMTTEEYFAGDAKGEIDELTAAWGETEREVKRALTDTDGNNLRALHGAVEQYLLRLRTVTAEDYARGATSADAKALAVRLMFYGVSCPTQPAAFEV